MKILKIKTKRDAIRVIVELTGRYNITNQDFVKEYRKTIKRKK
jgi:hypothetical protein